MDRISIINTIGNRYLTSNVENGEYSYPKIYKEMSIPFSPLTDGKGRRFEKLDIRIVKDGVSVLIETKQNFRRDLEKAKAQLSAYVEYEKRISTNKIIAILANTNDDDIMVWRGVVSDADYLSTEKILKSIDEYVDFYTSKINNKEQVMQNTYKLNELLHKHGINEKIRSQFVGTCLLALKNGFQFLAPSITTSQIRAGIKDVLEQLLNGDINKAEKLVLLNNNILNAQNVKQLDIDAFREILTFINDKILPFINDKSTAGQDLLNLFFVAFNKYVGKSDKNQAFTPDHITDFMAKICSVNKHSIVLDPCCGSGAFLVRAMTQALDDCSTEKEQNQVKKSQIFGIEFDENVFGLATTNMLIHSDGNSNIMKGSCFELADRIKEARPNVVLMNPPYNATRNQVPKNYSETWKKDKKEDPSKGLYFVKFVIDTLNSINQQATLAALLPVSCAIGTSDEIGRIKKEILENNTLDAVFTLPAEVFYPGASASACCMVFKIGQKHNSPTTPDTYFGYYKDDGFKKKKNLGRIEQLDPVTKKSKWEEIEQKWIDNYRNRKEEDGFSVVHKVGAEDEWLCEAYMKTDYSKLTQEDFEKTIREFIAYKIETGGNRGNE